MEAKEVNGNFQVKLQFSVSKTKSKNQINIEFGFIYCAYVEKRFRGSD